MSVFWITGAVIGCIVLAIVYIRDSRERVIRWIIESIEKDKDGE